MPYNTVADSIHTKKLCSRLNSNEVQFYTEYGRFAFLQPPWRLTGNVYCSSSTHWKVIVDSLLVIVEHFSLGVSAQTLRSNIDWKSAFSLQRGQSN